MISNNKKDGTIGSLLRDGTMHLLHNFPDEMPYITKLINKFVKTETLGNLVLYLPKVTQEGRFNLINSALKASMPEDFPEDNIQLWNAIYMMVHITLATTNNPVPSDAEIAEKLDVMRKEKNPYKLPAPN